MEARSVNPLPPSASSAAPSPSHPPTYPYPPIIIILTIILLVFFFGFFSIYFSRCFMENMPCTWHLWQATSGAGPPPGGGGAPAPPLGLDIAIVQSFPTFPYSTVKEYRKEKYGLECAICLVEFQGSDLLRLLTTCYHVFHQECIDLWLESHKTCPVCRRNLESRAQSPAKSPGEEQGRDRSFRITINDESERDDEDEDRIRVVSSDDHEGRGGEEIGKIEPSRFSRSHSTGHSSSTVEMMRQRDRYTLILPEHVTSDIINRGGHNPSQSWPTFGEGYTAHESNNNNANNSNDNGNKNAGLAEVSGVQKNV